MTSTTQEKGGTSFSTVKRSAGQRPGKPNPTVRQKSVGTPSKNSVQCDDVLQATRPASETRDMQARTTAIEQCVQHELRRYFDMLEGEAPANLYRMVIRQAEQAVINMVMEECRGNQTRASEWLGISRGNLRTKLANMIK